MILSLVRRAFQLLAAVPVEGCLVEFGVYKGDGLLTIARLARQYLPRMPAIYGFDSFTGMPPTASPLAGALAEFWAPGTFRDTSVSFTRERLKRHGVEATLVPGLFSELRPLAEYGIRRVRFAHIDADIYEGYRDALRLLTPHVDIGSVLLFDEVVPPVEWRYQSIRQHGQRAVREWELETGCNLHLIRFEWTAALAVLVDEEYLRRYGDLIVRLRKDDLVESLWHIARIVLGRELEPRVHLD